MLEEGIQLLAVNGRLPNLLDVCFTYHTPHCYWKLTQGNYT